MEARWIACRARLHGCSVRRMPSTVLRVWETGVGSLEGRQPQEEQGNEESGPEAVGGSTEAG